MQKQKDKLIWFGLVCLAAIITIFMHTYKLCDIPFGLNVDEAGAAYDALNIARYGVDRWLNSYPVYFTNYGDGQNALYIYITAILIKLFGISKLVIRAGIVIASFIGGYYIFRYSTYAFKEKYADAVCLMLYAILPVFTMTQRFGLESHLMLAAGIASVYFLARAMETGRVRYYLGAGIVCGLTLYTYALAYIVLPICLLVLILYGIRLKSFNIKRVVAFVLPLAILATPLVLVQLVNLFDLPAFRLGPLTITKLITYRSNEVGAVDLWQNFKNVLFNVFLWDNRSYNSTSLFGNMYFISIPFIAVGFGKAVVDAYYSVKKKVFDYSVPMLAWLLGQFVIGMLLNGNTTPNNTRMIGIFGCLLYFLVAGLVFVWNVLHQKHLLQQAFAGIIGAAYLVGFVCFGKYYFAEFNTDAYPFNWLFYEDYESLGDFVKEHKGEAFLERATAYPLNYIYYLLEFEVDPYEFNLPVNGKERYLQHEINEYLAHTDYRYNYVVYEKDNSSQQLLDDMGYEKYEAGEFMYYVTPLENYTEKQHAGELFAIDYLAYGESYIQMSGWCVDETNKQTFASVVLKGESEVYRAEVLARNDVAKLAENDAYVNCGYVFLLPTDLFEKSQDLYLYGIGTDGTKTLLYSWTNKLGTMLKSNGIEYYNRK